MDENASANTHSQEQVTNSIKHLQLTHRQELIRISSHRLFVLLLTFLCVMMAWAALMVIYPEVPASKGTLPVAIFVGILGGLIGIQNRIKTISNEDLLLLSKSVMYLMLAPLVGGFLAVLLYVLFISGLLEGALFPTFEQDMEVLNEGDLPTPVYTANKHGVLSMFTIHAQSYQDYAKLIFWCFVAGFSERFVTNIISTFESSGGVQSEHAAVDMQRGFQAKHSAMAEDEDRG